MRIIIIIVISVFNCGTSFCQSDSDYINIDSILMSSHPDSTLVLFDYNSLRAEVDIANNKPVLLLPGTIGCPPRNNDDSLFESKYGALYTCPGCISFGFQNLKGYNNVVFDYLTKLYGNEWVSEIRQDVIGVKNYR